MRHPHHASIDPADTVVVTLTDAAEAADRIPLVLDLIGSLVGQPKNHQPDSFEQAAELLAGSTGKQRWHLLRAALTVVDTLGDAYKDITGTSGLAYLDTGVDWPMGPDSATVEAREGTQAALQVLTADSDASQAAFADRYTSGQATPAEAYGALVLFCSAGYSIVLALAGLSQMTPKKTWKTILPVLVEP